MSASRAPCEACPPCCNSCAWEASPSGSAQDPKRQLKVVRAAEQYACVRKDASIVVDEVERRPFMRVGDDLLPLSPVFGDVIRGSKLEADIASALS